MLTAAQRLGKFAAELKFEDIPPAAVERAKDCIIDTVALSTYGAQLPWSRMVAEYARRYGQGGPCTLIGAAGVRVHAPYAALANGVFANALELDTVRHPTASTNPGATLLPPALAMCEETAADGKTAIAALVAGCEVLFRIAKTMHSAGMPSDKIGFQGASVNGPYGAAVAAGRVLKLDAEQMTHALGIAGSLSSGLLAATKSKQGGMLKRLHLGRAAESGILAARLASLGYAGPETVLDGKFGLLETFCRDADAAQLTAGLGEDWETLRISMKRYPLHGAAQVPVQALRELLQENALQGADIATVLIEAAPKMLTHHDIREPSDIAQAQYSAPFCLALALFRDPDDPRSLDDALSDADILAACRHGVELRVRPKDSTYHSRVTLRTKDGREFARSASAYKGRPSHPLSRAELRSRLMVMSGDAGKASAERLFERLEHLEAQPRFSLA